ncbi:bifunctional nuclease family protein [Pseudonocardia sp. MH-G8]|uniref:bifunctional nuclease family protein n=1 Tax=Pseudonocardia sp. MH-G8 TaxID=1854588 RepID=UPI000B9FF7C4|nr:bifunctional nuclease family protein [Pseudonocardia sp. MH-G8]OZM77165.1 hypothetical protein CFP66_36635 [Pseudonocardia sp. MH-G8]
MREMQVLAIGLDVQRDAPVLLLQEAVEKRRVLPVWIGFPEAAAIESELRRVPAPRPTSHHLIGDVVAACARQVEQVCVTGLHDSVFHAEVVLDGDIRVSARVSDAVVLAVHLGVPIQAENTVLDEAALPEAVICDIDQATGRARREDGAADEVGEIERFRRFIDTVSPADFEP